MAQAHSHHHDHEHPVSPRRESTPAAWSLLRASLAQRFAGVAVLLAGLWVLVVWALRT